jgi:hypothetical protein
MTANKDALCNRFMGLNGGHACGGTPAYRVGDVTPGEVEVLESPNQAAVGSRVADRAAMSEETLA